MFNDGGFEHLQALDLEGVGFRLRADEFSCFLERMPRLLSQLSLSVPVPYISIEEMISAARSQGSKLRSLYLRGYEESVLSVPDPLSYGNSMLSPEQLASL